MVNEAKTSRGVIQAYVPEVCNWYRLYSTDIAEKKSRIFIVLSTLHLISTYQVSSAKLEAQRIKFWILEK